MGEGHILPGVISGSDWDMRSAQAEKLIEENDRMYHARYKQITGTYRGDRHNRDILIDAELLGVERTADYLESLVKTLESEGKFDGE